MFVPYLVVHCFVFCNYHEGEERAGCFTLYVFSLAFNNYLCSSSSRCLGLVCSVIVVFYDHTLLPFWTSIFLSISLL